MALDVFLHPFSDTEDWVAVNLGNGHRSWGRCNRDGDAVFVPLSGFPKELVPEVQEALNNLKGCEPGTGPEPVEIIDSGPTNEDAIAIEDDEDEYE